MADTSPLSRNRPGAAKALWFVIPFGLLFAVIGFIAFWFVTLKPVLRAAASADWPAVECEILASELDSRRGSKGGTNYRAIIRYRYEWAGEVREIYLDLGRLPLDQQNLDERGVELLEEWWEGGEAQ